jgi:lysozyme
MFDLSHNNLLAASSYAQDALLFAQAKGANWVAMMHKLTQGATFVDPVALGRYGAAVQAGLLVGGYHYMTTTDPVPAQVANFMQAVGKAKAVAGTFVLCLDFEPSPATNAAEQMADAFVTAIRSVTGQWPLLYTGRWDIPSVALRGNLPACPLWLAEYGTNPVVPAGFRNWCLHQYSDGKTGPNPVTIPGIGAVDQSEYAGSLDELAAWWNKFA